MKIYELEFKAYELLEADGGGIRDNVMGYTHSLEVATEWKAQSQNYRSFVMKTINHRYCVTESIADFKDAQNDKLIQSAKKKLSKEELDALTQSVLKQS
jgi:hypothetical protein